MLEYYPMRCPWENWQVGQLGFCEAQLCSWIKQPGNTWSNIGYIAVGLWIILRARRDQAGGLSLIAYASIFTGIGSIFFHASGTFIGQSLDYLGMFLEAGAMTALNCRRWKNFHWVGVYSIFVLTTLLMWGVAISFPGTDRWLFSLGSPCYLIEIRLYFLYGKETQYRFLLYSFLLMLLATAFWALDLSGILCNPNNHLLSGHAIWHLLSAGSLMMLYYYYQQFSVIRNFKQ